MKRAVCFLLMCVIILGAGCAYAKQFSPAKSVNIRFTPPKSGDRLPDVHDISIECNPAGSADIEYAFFAECDSNSLNIESDWTPMIGNFGSYVCKPDMYYALVTVLDVIDDGENTVIKKINGKNSDSRFDGIVEGAGVDVAAYIWRTAPDTPSTGDAMPLIFWGIMTVLSFLGMMKVFRKQGEN